jgi:hypothetical protein
MTSHTDFRRDPTTGRYTTDDDALKKAVLDLGELVSILMIRLDADQGIDTADLVEGLTRWREAVEDIDTARGNATMVIERERHQTFPFTDADLDDESV